MPGDSAAGSAHPPASDGTSLTLFVHQGARIATSLPKPCDNTNVMSCRASSVPLAVLNAAPARGITPSRAASLVGGGKISGIYCLGAEMGVGSRG